jgi:hypothetical protein
MNLTATDVLEAKQAGIMSFFRGQVADSPLVNAHLPAVAEAAQKARLESARLKARTTVKGAPAISGAPSTPAAAVQSGPSRPIPASGADLMNGGMGHGLGVVRRRVPKSG